MEYFPFVVQAVPGEKREIYAYFSDGSIRLFDISKEIRPGTVFDALRDERFFRERLTIIDGAVAWDVTGNRNAEKCIDIDPLFMYQTAKLVQDPLMGNAKGKEKIMTDREQAANMIDIYMDLLRLEKAEDKETEIQNQLCKARAKLEALGVIVDNLVIK